MSYRYMNKLLLSTSLLSVFIFSIFIASPVFASIQIQKVQSKAHLPFIKNQGQKDAKVAYYTNAMGGSFFVTQQGELVYSLPKETKQGTVSWAFKESFITSKTLKPNQTGNKQFVSSLSLGKIAPGIHVKLKTKKNNIEKLFYLSAGAEVANIKVALEGIEGSHLNEAGQLVLETGLGPVAFTKPVAFQMQGDKKSLVDVAYTLNNNQYGFALGEYDHSKEIVIDPLLASTFVGGGETGAYNSIDRIVSVASDGDFVYVGGYMQSPDFPTALGYDTTVDRYGEGFVLRFNNDLSTLVNGTFIGTSVYAIKLDVDGTVVAVGQSGPQFPISEGAYSIPYTIFDSAGYVARFSADLTRLISSSVVLDVPYITVLELGNGSIYFGGTTINPDLPVTENVYGPKCFCPVIGAYDLREKSDYIGRLSADFTTLEAFSYIPHVQLKQILISPDSSLYVSGSSVAHYDGDLTTQYAATPKFLGASGIALGDGFLVGVGTTRTGNLIATSGAYDTSCGTDGNCDKTSSQSTMYGGDAFVVKYSLDLQDTIALTYIGGSLSDELNYVTVDAAGDIIVAGNTYSNDFPTTSNAFDQTYNGVRDVVIARFSSDLSRLSYSSYLGGAREDVAGGLAQDSSGYVFIGGKTAQSSDFPATNGAFSTTFNGGASDAFISKFDTLVGSADPAPEPTPEPTPDPAPAENIAPIADAGSDQTVAKKTTVYLNGSNSSDSDGTIINYHWTQISGKTVKLKNTNSAIANFYSPRVKRDRTKTLKFELTVTDELGATSSDQVTINVEG